MSSRPAVPLVKLIHNKQTSSWKRHHETSDGAQDVASLPGTFPASSDEPVIPASLRTNRPIRSSSHPSMGSLLTNDSTQRPGVKIPGKINDGRPKPHIAPVISSEANPGVRTVWDEDWPHHRTPSDPKTHTLGSSVTDFASNGATAASRSNFLISTERSSNDSSNYPPTQAVAPPNTPAPAASPVIKSVPVPMQTPTVPNPTLTTEQPLATARQIHEYSLPVQRNMPTRNVLGGTEENVPPERAAVDTNSSTRGIYNRTIDRQPVNSVPVQWDADKYNSDDYIADDLRRTGTATLRNGHDFSQLFHKPQPVARNWETLRKRFVAAVTCANTALIGVLIGIYAGEVPAIQYALADQHHHIILGNVVLFAAMGLVVLIFWPLPLLHGRKPYTLAALAIALPLQIPQAVVVDQPRGSNYRQYTVGLLFARALSGLAFGFAHTNFISTLLDLFGASLQSESPHGEVVVTNDVRRHGGGMGLWLGLWSFCFSGSLSVGFMIGAEIISGLNVSWGFYIGVILIACALLLNVITPETRRAAHRKTVQEVQVGENSTAQRVARGEIKMHVFGTGPKWWWEEVFAGLYLSFRMIMHTGFLVIALYVAWIYAEIVLIIVLLGNLLSAGYRFRPEYVGLGVLGVAIGALLSVPTSKANIFSRSRSRPARTDSMSFQPRVTWTSHFTRRIIFMTVLPLAGLAYTLASRGRTVHWMVPIIFAAVIGYISNLAIAECNGIIMETFDTSDLQPGTNSRHRLQSLPPSEAQRRTSYSSYPRVSAGFFVSQSLGFFFAAAATGVGGAVTRKVGAQKATAITAGILMLFTLLLTVVLWRYKTVQVIPNEMFGHYFGSVQDPGSAAPSTVDQSIRRGSTASVQSDRSWRAVVIGFPSGKVRRMSWLELGSLSRWTEIRRLNRLLNRSTTQALNPGWR